MEQQEKGATQDHQMQLIVQENVVLYMKGADIKEEMKCDDCMKDLHHGALLTEGGNEIDYSECEVCGIVEVMGMDVEKEEKDQDK